MTAQPRRPVRSARVRKAGDKPLPAAVYDQHGRLVGIVMDPDKIQPVDDGSADVDMEPMPPAEVGTPADGLAKAAKDLKKAARSAPDAAERIRAADVLNGAAIIGLDRIHGRRPPGSAA